MSRETSLRIRTGLIILAAACCYLIGNDRVALWDRDEPRNAQAARQMLQSGDWVVPKYLDKVRTAKPVFTYWCQALAMSQLGDTVFAARLPSVVAMVLTLVLLAIAIDAAAGAERAMWTVFILATSMLVIGWSAKTSLTDAMLLLWITLAQVCLFAIYRRLSMPAEAGTAEGGWEIAVIFAGAIGLAGLTKGPVVLGVLATTTVALLIFARHEFRHWHIDWDSALTKIVLFIGIVALIVGPWLYLVNKRAPDFIGTSLSRDVLRRTFEPLEQHRGPPGYYLLMVWPMFFPWSLLLPAGIALAWKHRGEPLVRFCLAAVIGPWLMLELVQTKLPHYMLPIFPPLAFLCADALVRCIHGEHRDLVQKSFIVAAGVWAVIVIALGLAPWLAMKKFGHLPTMAMTALSVAAIVYAFAVFIRFQLRKPAQAAAAMGVGMMAIIAILFGWYLPRAWFLRTSVCVADILKTNGATNDVQMIAYKEPSLAFYQGGTIREQSENDFLLTHPPREWPRWIVIRGDVWERLPASMKQNVDVIGSCPGFNYADRGRIVNVYVLRRKQ